MKKIAKVLILFGLLIIAAGAALDPYWWYRFLFQRQFDDSGLWTEAFTFLVYQWGWWIMFSAAIIYAILILQRTTVPDRLLEVTKNMWGTYGIGKRAWIPWLILILLFVAGIRTAPQRSTSEQHFAKIMADNDIQMKKSQEFINELNKKDKPPLAEPTMFLFLDAEVVASLYGQFEPELALAEVANESKATNTAKGDLTVDKVLTLSAGVEQDQKRSASYKATPKTNERKLKELINYLYDKHLVSRFGGLETQSDERRNLDQAINLLTSKYGVVLNNEKLRELRDRLFAQELANLEKRLTDLKGLVLIEGDWFVEVTPESYKLKRRFVENVTNPAICEVKLHKSSIPSRGQDI